MKRVAFVLLPVILAGCGTDVSGPGASLFSCLYSAGSSLDLGEVLQVAGQDNQGVCISDGDNGQFLYIPFYGRAGGDDSDNELPLAIRGIGFGGGGGSSALYDRGRPVLLPGDPSPSESGLAARIRRGEATLDWAFHDELRRREVRELGPRIRPGPAETAVQATPLSLIHI